MRKIPKPDHLDGANLFRELIKEMRRNPKYLSGDDDLTTTGGTIRAAIMVIGRMSDDLKAKR